MNVRRLTTADANLLPQAINIQQAAISAGTFDEWKGIAPYTRARLASIVQDNDQRLFGGFDDTGALRGILHVRRVGIDPVSVLPLWEFVAGIYDPTLGNLSFGKIYLLAVTMAAETFPGIAMHGKVVAGSQLDQLWQARIGQYRTEIQGLGGDGTPLTLAAYTVPSEVVAAL